MSVHNGSPQLTSPGSLLAGSILAFLAVALGAFGAHGLKETLESAGKLEIWKTAVDYQFWHALALLALAFRPAGLTGRSWAAAAICFVVGVVLFSGSLYWLALGGPRWLGPITPLGGTGFLAGWLILAIIAAKELKPRR